MGQRQPGLALIEADQQLASLDLVPEINQDLLRTFQVLLGFCEMNRLVFEKFSGLVDDRDLAARALSWIDAHHGNLAGRRSQQQRAKVLLENFDRLGFRPLSQNGPDFVLDGGRSGNEVIGIQELLQSASNARRPCRANTGT